MYTTLESVMKLEYPAFEVLFAVQDEKDEALPVVRMVMEKYPSVPARIIINPKNVGVNPKINNLMAPFAEAKYDLLWVLDVTIAVTPGTLGRAVDAFLDTPRLDIESSPLMGDEMRHPPARGDVGLVHQVPFAVIYQKSWGSLIEQAYLNSTHAKMYLAIVSLFYSDPRGRAHDAKNATKVDSCVVGKSNLYSRSNITSLATPSPTLRRLPSPPAGLEGFGPFLAEDNMIALGLWHQQGLQHAMTSDTASTSPTPPLSRDSEVSEADSEGSPKPFSTGPRILSLKQPAPSAYAGITQGVPAHLLADILGLLRTREKARKEAARAYHAAYVAAVRAGLAIGNHPTPEQGDAPLRSTRHSECAAEGDLYWECPGGEIKGCDRRESEGWGNAMI
ncbi:ceramide glucosyltransferase, partial [Tremellales sp. Uapishka_1]